MVPFFLWSPQEEGCWAPGAAIRWWLHHSLLALGDTLQSMGSRLIIRQGPTLEVFGSLIRETGARAVYWNRLYEPLLLKRDARVKDVLRKSGVQVESYGSALMNDPWNVLNRQGKPFQMFTPFWRTCQQQGEPEEPAPMPRSIPAPLRWPRSLRLDELDLLPTRDWAEGLSKVWKPGEKSAQRKLKDFCAEALEEYPLARNLPAEAGTSKLSPHLHFGEIGPRQIWQGVQDAASMSGSVSHAAAGSFLRQLGWREFAHHLLYHFPFAPEKPLRTKFAKFPWKRDLNSLRAWQNGMTGYPLVDAGMRELWATGWMHNRVRMIVASFLVKDLLLPWNKGAEWFWDTLVDADLANNTLGWQWAAGCGADAAPYFRVFNPVLQGAKFDPRGDYVRRWIPELESVPLKWVHEPWKAPADIRRKCDYPAPIVDHVAARNRALEAFSIISRTR